MHGLNDDVKDVTENGLINCVGQIRGSYQIPAQYPKITQISLLVMLPNAAEGKGPLISLLRMKVRSFRSCDRQLSGPSIAASSPSLSRHCQVIKSGSYPPLSPLLSQVRPVS